MRQPKSGASWDSEFRAGKYEFLKKPAEQARLDAIAAMIERSLDADGPCEVVDIGCGEGLLAERLPVGVTRYVGVDISAVALARQSARSVPVARVRASLADWDGNPPATARRILVASEVLYYDRAAVGDLKRLADTTGTVSDIIVSCVAAHPDKPNWAEASEHLWADLAATGWRLVDEERLEDEDTGIAWDVARYRV